MEQPFKDLKALLLHYRDFDPKFYIEKKVIAINNFFREEGLDACVLGVSGGLDSAVTFKLLELASKAPNSPIKLVSPMILPISTRGTTGQYDAIKFAEMVIKVSDSSATYDLTKIANQYSHMFPDIKPWGEGQIASIVRTPMLYGQAAYLQEKGYKSIVVGTTNRDEGSYIGFFGKASDAMVDLQPIADIHKTEVRAIAKLLGVPKVIIERTPVGDVYDASTDEETIGAPYWFIQLYLLFKDYMCMFDSNILYETLEKLSLDENALWGQYSNAIEAIHNKNAHKYKVGMPCRFIDVMNRRVIGGWGEFKIN